MDITELFGSMKNVPQIVEVSFDGEEDEDEQEEIEENNENDNGKIVFY